MRGAERSQHRFYVADNASGSFESLPDGAYRVQYAVGDDLAEGCLTFVTHLFCDTVHRDRQIQDNARAV